MLVNKWINLALGISLVVVGYLGTVNWSILTPAQGGTIVSLLGVLRIILSALQPPASQANIVATGGSVITHT